MKYYTHVQEVWDSKTCEKMAKKVHKDGMGTPYPFKGYIGNHYGKVRYNGGCIRNGNFYDGEERLIPKVAKGFEVVKVPNWGYRIIKVVP